MTSQRSPVDSRTDGIGVDGQALDDAEGQGRFSSAVDGGKWTCTVTISGPAMRAATISAWRGSPAP